MNVVSRAIVGLNRVLGHSIAGLSGVDERLVLYKGYRGFGRDCEASIERVQRVQPPEIAEEEHCACIESVGSSLVTRVSASLCPHCPGNVKVHSC